MNKSFKRILALLCTLTLVLSLCTVFASATNYVTVWPTKIYPGQGPDNPMYSLSKGMNMSGSSGWTYSTGYIAVTRSSYSGYTVKKCIIPSNKCWKTHSSCNICNWNSSTQTMYTTTEYIPSGAIVSRENSKTDVYGHVWYYIHYATSASSYVQGYIGQEYVREYTGY